MTRNKGIQRSDFHLPIFIYPTSNKAANTLLLVLSGDGGWVDFEDQISLAFAEKGFNTIGFNSRSYFWNSKTKKETARDLTLLIEKYAQQYKTNQIVLVGYSFGADVVPFIYNRLPVKVKSKVIALALLSPFATTDFDVHNSDLLNIAGDKWKFKVQPEVEKIRIPTFCFYGEKEAEKPLSGLRRKKFFLKLLPGNHRYDPAAYQEIINTLAYTLK